MSSAATEKLDRLRKIKYNHSDISAHRGAGGFFMEVLTVVFPLLTAALIVYLIFACPRLKTAELAAPGADRHGFSRRDAAVLACICAVYAAVAFFALGNTSSAQSFCHFEGRGSYADIELDTDAQISDIRFFCGLNTGNYFVQFSDDGVNYTDVGRLEQPYTNIFKWCSITFDAGAVTHARYIRLIADSDLYLGEVAIYDGSDTIVPLSQLSYSQGAAKLFDEQDTVPAESTYMNSSYFDEIYHPRTALENIDNIYPYEISHPPLGKLILSLGMRLFGVTPFGWRFMGTLFGVLMLPCLYVFIKKMFGGTAVPACGTTIFAFDFMHYVQTRLATVDTYAVFFIILMYLFMYLYISSDRLRYLGWSGVMFGIGAACKWTGLYAGAGLGVIWLAHWVLKGKNFRFGEFFDNCLYCLVFFVLIPGVIYYASYYPYGAASGMSGVGMYFKKEYADIVLNNQSYMLHYHEGVHSAHPYSSRWYQWIFDIRPILYYLQYVGEDKVSAFGAFVNPLLCWGGLIALFGLGYLAIRRRDRVSAFLLAGYLAELVPWIFITRTTFEYHYFACTVFLTLALCRIFALMRDNSGRWRRPVFAFTVGCVALFALFYPALSGLTVSLKYSDLVLGWLPTWPF